MTVTNLNDMITGAVVAPGDPGWDEARHFHAGIGEPDVIVRPASVDDVQRSLRYASAEGLEVTVRGGGHSAWGTIPGGLTLDLGNLDAVEVDGTTVRVGGGAVWGDVLRTLAAHGLGISAGDTGSVGVGGLTLGGGIGWMVRAWGLAADQLVGVQLVTAAGDVVEATDASHPELMWALRGGEGNFGVVTRFDFRAHELRGIVFATLRLTGDSRPVLRTLRDLMRSAPRQLTATFMHVPPMDPNLPPGASITACWIGDDEAAARAALAPLLALDEVTEEELGVRSYPDILLETPEFDPDQPIPPLIGANALIHEVDDDAVEQLVSFRKSHPASVLFLRSLGGAYGDVPQDSTAFPARDAAWFAMTWAFDVPGMLDDDDRAQIRSEAVAIEALGEAVYGNFNPTTDPTLVGRMFPPSTMARLSAIKREWDPRNMFSRNHNVRPG